MLDEYFRSFTLSELLFTITIMNAVACLCVIGACSLMPTSNGKEN